MTKIKNFFKKSGAMLTMALVGAGALVKGAFVHAAADAELQAGLASTTAIFTDNKGVVINWAVGIFSILIVITLIFGALRWSRRQAGGIFGGKRRR